MRRATLLVLVVSLLAFPVGAQAEGAPSDQPVVVETTSVQGPYRLFSYPKGMLEQPNAGPNVCWGIVARKRNDAGWLGYYLMDQHTTWCGNGNVITYRSSFDTVGMGGFFSLNYGPVSYKESGGTGYNHVQVATTATFIAQPGGAFWSSTPVMHVYYYPWLAYVIW